MLFLILDYLGCPVYRAVKLIVVFIIFFVCGSADCPSSKRVYHIVLTLPPTTEFGK